MSDLERLNIVLAARDREFARAMDRNTRRIERFARRAEKDLGRTSKQFDVMGAASKRLAPLVAALGAGAVVGKLRETVSALDDIGKTADKMGLTTDALQELRTVAESAGIAQSSLDSSMERFNKRLGEAALGSGAAAKALKEMGLKAEDLVTMGLDDALSEVADHIASIEEPTERAARAAALFGREGVAMVNLLREGASGMEKMRQEARDLGIVIDESVIRGAEDAQTQLDLMGRVISANVNSALVELAPLLVGATTVLADFVRFVASGIDAARQFAQPQTDLQIATDNLVAAMADEITQSQLLEAALGRGINMSVSAAKTKLEEARARHENAKAALAEQRAMTLNSDTWADLTAQISQSNTALRSMGDAYGDYAPAHRADAFEAESLRLVQLIQDRQALLEPLEELNSQLERSGENMATLEAGLASAKGGIVNIDGTAVTPIQAGARQEISGSGKAAGVAVPALTDYANVMDRIKEVFGAAGGAGQDYNTTLAELRAMYDAGKLSAEEFRQAVATVEAEMETSARIAQTLEDAFRNTFTSAVTGAESLGDAVSNLLSQLAQMAANAAFQGLFGGSSLFSGMAGLFMPSKSFDGGGYTGGGSRSGGLDGKGGFMAMLHPQETVIDHTKGQGVATSGGAVEINVNVSGARGNSEISDMVQNGVRTGLAEYDRSVLPRRVGQISSDPRRIS
jgi:hypothetical protein